MGGKGSHRVHKHIFVTSEKQCEFPEFTSRIIYRFTGKGNCVYLVHLERFAKTDLYAVKFFPKNHSASDDKFNLPTGQFEPRNIFATVLDILKSFAKTQNENASFCYIAAPTPVCEGYNNNRKYRFYQRIGYDLISTEIWQWVRKVELSAVFLLNRKALSVNPSLLEDLPGLVQNLMGRISINRSMCEGCSIDCKHWLRFS